MTTLRRNIFANLAGGTWVAVLTLVITPLQVNLLGMEAYGVIGFIAVLQIAIGVLDLGLSSTITRELAGDHSPDRTRSQPLLSTAITFYWGLAAVIGLILFTSAGSIASAWFHQKSADIAVLEQAIQVVAIFLALRWPVALYSGVLTGVQRMDVLNVVKISAVSVRMLGGILVLLAWRDLGAFLAWTAFSALVEVLVYAVVSRVVVPAMNWRPGFSLPALRAVWGFSLSMSALAVLAMGITQIDRLLISKMLPLADLGYYSLAYHAATAISLILSAISSAMMPSFAAAYGAGAWDTLLRRYDNANRLTLFVTGFALFPLLFFGEPLLAIWVNEDAAAGAWRSLALLAGGFWMGAAVSNAFTVAVACRQVGLILKISALSVAFYVLILYWMIGVWGIEGAGAAWLLLNVSYVLVVVPMVHRAILNISTMPWFFATLLPFALLGGTIFGLSRLFVSRLPSGAWVESIGLILSVIVYGGLGYLLLGTGIRADFIGMFRRVSRA
jgi:O-antigen/teichoic acid export membrane protein